MLFDTVQTACLDCYARRETLICHSSQYRLGRKARFLKVYSTRRIEFRRPIGVSRELGNRARGMVEPRDLFIPQPLAKEAVDEGADDLDRATAVERAEILITNEPREGKGR